MHYISKWWSWCASDFNRVEFCNVPGHYNVFKSISSAVIFQTVEMRMYVWIVGPHVAVWALQLKPFHIEYGNSTTTINKWKWLCVWTCICIFIGGTTFYWVIISGPPSKCVLTWNHEFKGTFENSRGFQGVEIITLQCFHGHLWLSFLFQ